MRGCNPPITEKNRKDRNQYPKYYGIAFHLVSIITPASAFFPLENLRKIIVEEGGGTGLGTGVVGYR